jgi:4-hydroxy-tetrahydrodipicolinate reductase
MRIALVGYGAIGAGILSYCLERGHDVRAVIDSDPRKAGKTVREISRLDCDVRVLPDVAKADPDQLDVAIFSTRSRLADTAADMERMLSVGVPVVSTCEELAWPGLAGGSYGASLDTAAKKAGVAIVGVGVNPGFVMDWIPALVASASRNPTQIHVTRSVNVGRRRKQLQNKMGVGLTKARFEKGVQEGSLGHVGLQESLHIIAGSLGQTPKGVKLGIAPVLGAGDYVMGATQFVEGSAGDCFIRLDLEMTTTSTDFDLIEVSGDPHLKLRFENGVFGDSATVALTVSAAERIRHARPGLVTVLELPLVR